MKYDAPGLTALTPAISVIQGRPRCKPLGFVIEGLSFSESTPVYEECE